MSTTRSRVFLFVAVAVLGSGFMTPVLAQTIDGTLMEQGGDRAISLGLVILMTEAGDSVTSAVTDASGRFRVQSDQPGGFVLIASAFGFKETRAGVFELGDGGSMDIEFRIAVEAMSIDGILISLQRPVMEHQLVRNGYVRRLQSGLGAFITPYDIANSPAFATADLFRGIPGVAVRAQGDGGGFLSYQGDMVQMQSATGYCTPTVYLDGLRLSPGLVASSSLEDLIPISEIDAAEVYRRPAEIPIEYSGTSIASVRETDATLLYRRASETPIEFSGTTPLAADGDFNSCGVVVFWTKHR